MGNDAPCYRCIPPNRYPGCHSKCKEYQEWKASEQEKKDAERKQREQEAALFTSYKHRRR